MFVLLGLGFKPEHFSCVMPSLFTKVLMLFVCSHMFIELLVGYICEILGVGVYWDWYYGELINNGSLEEPCKLQVPLILHSFIIVVMDLAFGSQWHVAQLHSFVLSNYCPSSSIITFLASEDVNATTTKINDLALFNLFQSHIKRKKKVECEVEKLFQNTWATKFPWVELVLEEGNKLHHVRYKICIVVKY